MSAAWQRRRMQPKMAPKDRPELQTPGGPLFVAMNPPKKNSSKRVRKTLLEKVSRKSVLEKAWKSVRSSSNLRSHGSDGISIEDFRREWFSQREKLHEELAVNKFTFAGYQGVAPKKDKAGS